MPRGAKADTNTEKWGEDASLEDIESVLNARLRAIETQLAEYKSLLDEADRIQRALGALHADAPPPPPRRAATGTGRAARGANQELVIDYIAENPGTTSGEIAAGTGIKRGVVYNLLTRLVRHGKLHAEESGNGGNRKYFVPEDAADDS